MKKLNFKAKAMSKAATLLSLLTASVLSSTVTAADLKVNISTIEKAEGEIMLAIYDSEDTFRQTESIASRRAAQPGEMVFSFPDLPAGTYAVMVFHDCNSNGELDANLLGIPKEPWGGSLQGKSVFGAPGWKDAKFQVPETGMSIEITLN